jgi:hypothetical protein
MSSECVTRHPFAFREVYTEYSPQWSGGVLSVGTPGKLNVEAWDAEVPAHSLQSRIPTRSFWLSAQEQHMEVNSLTCIDKSRCQGGALLGGALD